MRFYRTRAFLPLAWVAGVALLPTAIATATTQTPSEQGDSPAASGKTAASPTAPAPAPVAPERIAALVAQLDDDRFAVRESAQQELVAAGAQAVAAVGEAAAQGSLESSTRAVNILLGWSLSEGSELGLAALERLASLTNRPTEASVAAQRLADVREVAALKAIVKLGGRIDFDRQLAAFNGPAPSLQVVIGPKWKGGLEGLHHLQAVRRASTLSFHSSDLAEQATGQIAELTHLQRIEFYGVELSPEALGKLKEQLPNAAVEIRSGAHLGIAGSHNIMGGPNPAGAMVNQVLPDSAAARAGLQQGDVIAKFADAEVKDFEHLTREIAKCEPGQSVPIKVLRQGPPGAPQQTLDITVKFDRWGDQEQAANPAAIALPGNPVIPDPLSVIPRNAPREIILDNRR